MDKIFDKVQYTTTNKVYDNFVKIHFDKGLIDIVPQDYEGETVDETLLYLGMDYIKGTKIKSPIEEIIIYRSHIEHLIYDNDPHRKRHLNRAVLTIQKPNLIVKNNAYNYYIKLFSDDKAIKPHLQVVKVKSDGSFYVTNHKLNKKQADKIILEGQIIYDLSSLSDT